MLQQQQQQQGKLGLTEVQLYARSYGTNNFTENHETSSRIIIAFLFYSAILEFKKHADQVANADLEAVLRSANAAANLCSGRRYFSLFKPEAV